jgi:hypothetical protein
LFTRSRRMRFSLFDATATLEVAQLRNAAEQAAIISTTHFHREIAI